MVVPRLSPICSVYLLVCLCFVLLGPGAAVSTSRAEDDVEKNYYFGDYKEVVHILNAGLNRELHVYKALIGKTKQGLMRVGVMLTNQSGREFRIEAQALYFTADSKPLFRGLAKDQPWLPVKVNKVGPTEYYSQAISAEAKIFLIRLRYAPGEKTLEEVFRSQPRKQATKKPGGSSQGNKSMAERMNSKR